MVEELYLLREFIGSFASTDGQATQTNAMGFYDNDSSLFQTFA
jgi:hypothetical protein